MLNFIWLGSSQQFKDRCNFQFFWKLANAGFVFPEKPDKFLQQVSDWILEI